MGFFLLRIASFFSLVTAHLSPDHLLTAAKPQRCVSIFCFFHWQRNMFSMGSQYSSLTCIN